ASRNSLRALRPLRSDSRDELVYEARQGAPGPRPSITAAPEIAPAGHRLPRQPTWWVCPTTTNNVSAKAGPGGPRRIDHARPPRVCPILVAARDSVHRELTRRDCLNGESFKRTQ